MNIGFKYRQSILAITFFYCFLLLAPMVNAQEYMPLSFNVDSQVIDWDQAEFIVFDGAGLERVANPDALSGNDTDYVFEYVKNAGGQHWAGFHYRLQDAVNTTEDAVFRLNVWSPRSGIQGLMKLESLAGATTGDQFTDITVSEGWNVLEWDLSNVNHEVNWERVVIIMDLGGPVGEGFNTTWYVDDFELAGVTVIGEPDDPDGTPILPPANEADLQPLPISFNMDTTHVDWEGYTFYPFEGASLSRIENPDKSTGNDSDHVLQYEKVTGGAPWAGFFYHLEDTINATNDAVFRLNVWSPRADIQGTMKLELRENAAVNTGDLFSVNTTVAEEWTTLEWDLSGVNQEIDWDKLVVIMDLGAGPAGGTNYTWFLNDFELDGVTVVGVPDDPDDPAEPPPAPAGFVIHTTIGEDPVGDGELFLAAGPNNVEEEGIDYRLFYAKTADVPENPLDATEYQFGTTPGDGDGVNAFGFVLGGLEPGTEYTFWLYQYNSTEDLYSDPATVSAVAAGDPDDPDDPVDPVDPIVIDEPDDVANMQPFPIAFNIDTVAVDWQDYTFFPFEGAELSIIANPDSSTGNDTDLVLEYVKNPAGQPWGGFFYLLEDTINTTDDAVFRLNIWSPRADIQGIMKLESRDGATTGDLFADITVAEEWTVVEWDLSGVNHEVNWDMVTVIMDLDTGNPPQGGARDTWYLDDFELAGVVVVDDPDDPDDPDSPFAGGSGTPEDPYQIETIEHFQNVEENFHFVQISDIDATGFEFTKINHFGGVYDGGGHVISNLTITDGGHQAAPFRVVVGGHIKNLGLKNVNISGEEMTAGMVGEMTSGGLIENCFVTGVVDGHLLVGGIVGFITDGEIRNSYSHVIVKAEITQNAGIAGRINNGTVRNSYSVAQVSGVDQYAVLVGYNVGGTVRDSYWDTFYSLPKRAVDDGPTGTNVVGLATELMTGPAAAVNMTALDFDNIWQVAETGYPVLFWQDPADAIEPGESFEDPDALDPVSLPLDFEDEEFDWDNAFYGFEGGHIDRVENPQPDDVNSSGWVGRMVKGAGPFWAGAFMHLEESFTVNSATPYITMKVWSPRAGVPILMKLEQQFDTQDFEITSNTTRSGEWEVMQWNMSAAGFTRSWDMITMIFDFREGGEGDGGPNFTWYFDDLNVNSERVPTSADEIGQEIPVAFDLRQNYPNPFNPTTQIQFDIPEQAEVMLEVFNIMGQRVAVLASGSYQAGQHTVSFDATDLASGIYVYRLQAGSFTKTQKMMLVK